MAIGQRYRPTQEHIHCDRQMDEQFTVVILHFVLCAFCGKKSRPTCTLVYYKSYYKKAQL